MILFNDHTNGTDPGVFTPKAQVADNDLALGQLVELISQSAIWHESAIFVLEDDSQSGTDHVDAHRIPAYVISPWAKRGAVVSTRYDQYSFLRTAELIVGLRPLTIDDALATPLYDAFVSGIDPPDVEGTRYPAIQPAQPPDEVNPPTAAHPRLSAALPWNDTAVSLACAVAPRGLDELGDDARHPALDGLEGLRRQALVGLAQPARERRDQLRGDLGVAAQQAAHVGAEDRDRLDGLDRLDGGRALLLVEHGQLAEEVAGAEVGQRDRAPVGVGAGGPRVAGAHDVAGVRVVPLAEDDL